MPAECINFWKTSLQIFTHCDQRRNFVLGSLNLLRKGVITLVTKFWWFALTLILFYVLPLPEIVRLVMSIILEPLLFSLVLISIRPSIEPKNYRYYLSYWKIFALALVITALVPIHFLFIPTKILFFLLLADSDQSPNDIVQSLLKACKITLYTLPSLALLLLPLIILQCVALFILFHPNFASFLTYVFLHTIISCFFLNAVYTTLYVKLKHEQYNLFFK